MAGSSFGKVFRFTTAGESHGKGLCVIVDGVPSNLALCEQDIQYFLNQRRPGRSRYTTQRRELDRVSIISGVFEGYTTGAPVCMLIDNTDVRSRDYSEIARKFRPGHADFTYWMKYGWRDYRGGGRSSARETVCRVAAGAIARKVLGCGVSIRGALIQVGPYRVDRERWDWDRRLENDFFCPDGEMVEVWARWISTVRKRGSSTGAIIEIVVSGVPVGLGEPIYDKLDSDLARALMTINAVKGVEVGTGFDLVDYKGEDAVDEMYVNSEGRVGFFTNHAGGILGGISTGQDIVVRFIVKPTSSLLIARKTVDDEYRDTEVVTKGRHDPCVGIRVVPVGEAMVACVLADHFLRYQSYTSFTGNQHDRNMGEDKL